MPPSTFQACDELFSISRGQGRTLGTIGKYKLIREVGRGGCGVVYEGQVEATGERVAIKVVAKGSPARQRRILREAKALGELCHPAIVQLHDCLVDARGTYLVMEFLDGETLDVRVRRAPLRLSEALRVALDVSSAMVEAHRLGVIHRDLKPSNILVSDEDGTRARVIDFGLVRRIENPTHITRTGIFVGTPHYASPEQCGGTRYEVGAPSDVYSLGLIMYELLAGELPINGDAASAVAQQILCTPQHLEELVPEVGEELSRLVMRCLDKDSANRPAMEELEETLRTCLLSMDGDLVLRNSEDHDFVSEEKTRPKLALPVPAVTDAWAGILPPTVDAAEKIATVEVAEEPAAVVARPRVADVAAAPAAYVASSPVAVSNTRFRGLRSSVIAAVVSSIAAWTIMSIASSGNTKEPNAAPVAAKTSEPSTPAVTASTPGPLELVDTVEAAEPSAPAGPVEEPEALRPEPVAHVEGATPAIAQQEVVESKPKSQPAPIARRQPEQKRARKAAGNRPKPASKAKRPGRRAKRPAKYSDVSVPVLY